MLYESTNRRAHLVFAKEGQVEDDLDGLDVGGHDDELADTTVESLGSLVGSVTDHQHSPECKDARELTPSSTACSETPAGQDRGSTSKVSDAAGQPTSSHSPCWSTRRRREGRPWGWEQTFLVLRWIQVPHLVRSLAVVACDTRGWLVKTTGWQGVD